MMKVVFGIILLAALEKRWAEARRRGGDGRGQLPVG